VQKLNALLMREKKGEEHPRVAVSSTIGPEREEKERSLRAAMRTGLNQREGGKKGRTTNMP